MSTNNHAENLNAASINGDISAASIRGEVSGNGVLGGVTVGGVKIIQYPDIPIATTSRLGGVKVGDHLSITEDGVLSVIVANEIDEDNTHPVSAATVYTEVGNINALLQSI